MRIAIGLILGWVGMFPSLGAAQPEPVVGPRPDGAQVVTTTQLIRPAGEVLEVSGRPIDLVLSRDGGTLYVKDNRGIITIDTKAWAVRQELGLDGTTMGGLAMHADGARLYTTTADHHLVETEPRPDGALRVVRRIKLSGPESGGGAFPCGVALSADGTRAYVCLSRNNTLGIVDLGSGEVTGQIPVGVAPFSVKLSPDGSRAYVSNWGGRRAREGDLTAPSAGTAAVIQSWGGAASGSLSIIDAGAGTVIAEVETGLAPTGIAVSSDGSRVFVANSNADTVSVIDPGAARVIETISVRPDEELPFGSMPNALSLSPDGKTLFIANAGNNAVVVVRVDQSPARVEGFVPTGWYPGAVLAAGSTVYVANIKGIGSRSAPDSATNRWHVTWHRGSISRFEAPDAGALAAHTARVREDSRVPQTLLSLQRSAATNAAPAPIPANPGEPSVFEHVVYIIKENRTYDQVLGDMGKGNSEPSLCIFGRDVTPNQHALAEQFVLLDNFYCNGVISADGHSWATEGNVTPYLERAFGSFGRSYTFGDDPLAYSASGFVWDHILARGYSFRNYGEFDYADTKPAAGYAEIFKDWQDKTGRIALSHNIGVENVRRYSCAEFPGWDMDIPDQIRADIFLKELAGYEKQGFWPNFMIVYLPDDHTSGTAPGDPTPRSYIADNDLALGRIVEGITKSRFWPKTCIFVVEDDPQDGFDHVDGHRSIAFVVSPYTKRGEIVSRFYSQASVVHTMERIFGAVPANQLYAMAPLMGDCFTPSADLSPFTCLPNTVPLCELNPAKSSLNPAQRHWAEVSERLPLSKPDMIHEDTMNRVLWHAVKGVDAPYPAEWAGTHGRGLRALGLRLAGPGEGIEEDDDEDDVGDAE